MGKGSDRRVHVLHCNRMAEEEEEQEDEEERDKSHADHIHPSLAVLLQTEIHSFHHSSQLPGQPSSILLLTKFNTPTV